MELPWALRLVVYEVTKVTAVNIFFSSVSLLSV